jgi:hypothetical protein
MGTGRGYNTRHKDRSGQKLAQGILGVSLFRPDTVDKHVLVVRPPGHKESVEGPVAQTHTS